MSLLNDEQMSNKAGVEQQPVFVATRLYGIFTIFKPQWVNESK